MYFVSGRKYARAAENKLGTPSISMGSGFQYTARRATNGASSPNTLDTVEHVPTAWFLRFVGYNSAVTSHTTKNEASEKHLPTR